MARIFFMALFLLFSLRPQAQTVKNIGEDSIVQYVKEVKEISDKDNGGLWRTKLYGPIIFVDTKTKMAAANEPDSAGLFKKKGEIYFGQVPREFGAANTAISWGGKIWTVVLWPLPKNKWERVDLIFHELFHQFQMKNRLPGYSPACDHLDKFEGRLLLKLELEAFRKVINEYPDFSKADLQNAIAMRMYRYQKYPLADSLEHALEMNEGLATFTGFILSGQGIKQMKETVNKKIDNFYQNQTFTRSLAYITGYVYGFLLSDKNYHWNRLISDKKFLSGKISYSSFKVRASFDKLLIKYYKLKKPGSPDNIYQSIALQNKYNYNSIFSIEKEREDKRLIIEAENKRKFVYGPVLELPNSNMNIGFNPLEVQMLEDYGPIYPTLSVKADWGLLEVKKGGALVKDWSVVYLPLPENFTYNNDRIIKTDNWQLELANGWTIVEGKKKGNFVVVRNK
ncbi:MAG TPA: hypothetical protein VFN30_08005 [Chitinophagaceae bacterium]|nr:hypothetical protein [Chitinophagaceae bacterium]